MGPKLFAASGPGPEKNYRYSGSGQPRIRNEFEVKLPYSAKPLIKLIDTFSTKMLKINIFFIKKISLKSLYLAIICNQTHLQVTRLEYNT
jgi:hypothetical protein